MSRNAVIAIIVIILALAGGYWYWGSMQETNTTGSQDTSLTGTDASNDTDLNGSGSLSGDVSVDVGSSPVVVTYTENGFSPSKVTIKKGQAVRFVNGATGQDTWPASAVHPTHSVYPEKSANDCLGSSFDACKAVKPGESWTFTFNSVGEWRYHDHLHASKFGSVVVTE